MHNRCPHVLCPEYTVIINFSAYPKNSSLFVQCAFIRAHLEYASIIWSPHTVKYNKELERVQQIIAPLYIDILFIDYVYVILFAGHLLFHVGVNFTELINWFHVMKELQWQAYICKLLSS